MIPKGALEDITGVHETLIKELILVEALPRSPGAQDAPRRPQLRPKSQTGSTGPPREAQKTQHEPCGPVAAGGRGRIRPLILSRARATHTNTHARTHGFLRRHTSPSVTNYCHTPTDMINTRPSANYTPPLRSERQPMILSPPHITTGGSSVSGRSGPTATAIGQFQRATTTWPVRPTVQRRHCGTATSTTARDASTTTATVAPPLRPFLIRTELCLCLCLCPFPFFSSATRFFFFLLERLP